MNRFMGMMPSSEIEKEDVFRDGNGLTVTIQAGNNGWTILWADGSSSYRDEVSSTEENYNAAYAEAVSKVGELTHILKCFDVCITEG